VVDFDHADDGTPYIVMALLEGESLAARLKRQGPFRDLREVATIMRQVTAALGAAHRGQVVHRDLKPSNIFLCDSSDATGPLVKVVDFGLSKIAGGGRTAESALTRVDSVLGTPSYMSPEQACGRADATDTRSDVFGLGATLYTMLTGRPPFGGETIDEKLVHVAGGEIVETPLWRQLAPALRQAIERALSKDPARRQRSMEELWSELSAAFGVEPAAPREGRKIPWVWIGPGALALGLGIAAAVLWPGRSPTAAPDLGATSAERGEAADASPPSTARAVPDGRAARRARPRRRVPRRRRAKWATKATAAVRSGTLIVQSKARRDGSYLWAHVFLDGARVGQTALKLEHVAAGPHRIEVRRAGYRPVSRKVRVLAGERTRVLVELESQ